MSKVTRALWKWRSTYIKYGEAIVVLTIAIAITLSALSPASDPVHLTNAMIRKIAGWLYAGNTALSLYLTNATIRDIVGWLYAGSTALLAGFVFLVATLESQEPVRLKRGFYILYSGIFRLIIVHLLMTACVILYFARLRALLTIVQTFTFINAFYIVSMIFHFLRIFIPPKRRDNVMQRFLIRKIEYYYTVHTTVSKEWAEKQENINTILMEYGIEYNSDLHRDLYFTPIASGKFGYIAPKKKHLCHLGEEAQKILSYSSASHQTDEKTRVYHCITPGQRIATGTPLFFIPREVEGASAVQKTLSQLLFKKIRCNKKPTFAKTTYINTMQSFLDVMLQEQLIDVFQDYSNILQELLFHYIEHDDFAEERSRDIEHATDPFSAVFGTNHSILGWYHRIVEALVQSEKAEHAEWIEEILALYRKPVHDLYNRVELSQEQKRLLYKFLQELEGRYFQAGLPNQAQTKLQWRIMSQYDAFLVSLCKREQDMDAEEFDTERVTTIADQIILFHQARILKSVYNQSDIATFKETANKFIKFPGLMLHVGDFLQTALKSITPITQHPLSRRTDLDTVKKTYREYCAFQKMLTLFLYATYIFHTKKFSVKDSDAGNDPYLAFLIDGGLPTSRTEFIYLYGKLLDNPFILPGNSAVWEDWDWSKPPSRIDSSGISKRFISDGTFGFFCWYNLHKCEPASLLDKGQISQLFSLSFREQAENLAQRFQALIDDRDNGDLTKQQKDAAKNTVEFLYSLSQSYYRERNNNIVQSDLSEAHITEAKNAFQGAYSTHNALFLEALKSLQIAVTTEPLPDLTKSVLRPIRKLHEKRIYIMGDSIGYSGPQHEYAGYASAYIQKKTALIWKCWTEDVPKLPPAKFFEALSNLNDNYIVVCNSVNSPYIAHKWGKFFPEQQFPYKFIASPSLQEPGKNNDAAFHEQIATIEFQDNDTERKIPVACFVDRHGPPATTVTFIILPKSPLGTFQHYSFAKPENEILSVNDHAVRFKITDLGRDEELRNKIQQKNLPDFISKGTTEGNNLSKGERLREYVHLEITDAFEFTYSAPSNARLCGYIECDFRTARQR